MHDIARSFWHQLKQRVPAAGAALALSVTLVGCDVTADRSTPSGGGGAPAAGAEPVAPKKTVKVAWAPDFGPINKAAPPGHRWYDMVRTRECTKLLNEATPAGADQDDVTLHLYRGLAEACRGEWTKAKSDLRQINPANADDPRAAIPNDELTDATDCLMLSTLETLQRLVEAHESGPDVVVQIGGTAAPTCQPPPGELEQPEGTP